MLKNIISQIKKRKIIILILIVLLVVAFVVIGNPFKKGNNGTRIEKIIRGNIIQEVSETGTVEPTEEISLGFKTAGRIDKIDVKVGDIVEKGTELASLDKTNLLIQLGQSQASLAVAQTQYDKLSENAKNAAQQSLDSAYQDALNTLDDGYLKIYNAYNAVNSLQDTYFSTSDQESIKVRYSKDIINDGLIIVKPLLDLTKTSPTNENIDSANSKMAQILSDVIDALKTVREMCEESVYSSRVSSTDKTSIDNQRSYIITALTNINNSQQTISSDKIALQKAEDDIDYYQAKVKEAEANVDSYQQQILDATLIAPISGTITKVDKKAGETVQVTELPISLISLDPFQVKIDIYEEDIVKIKIGNAVDIKIAAFPNETLTGKVISIDPAEKLVEGVVYYEVTVAFDQLKDGVKPGMTADVVIKTANKENVLLVPKEAVSENGKTTVLIYKNGKTEEREVQIGLEGSDNKVEVVSGLSEGEEVAIE